MPDTKHLTIATQLVAVFVECIFYGIHLVTFVAALQTILCSGTQPTWAKRLRSSWSMFIVAMLMFIFTTLNLVLGMLRSVQSYQYDYQLSGGSAVKQIGANWINIIKPVCTNLQVIVADSVLIYRCWAVCDKSRVVVVFPILLWLGGIACAIFSLYMQIAPTPSYSVHQNPLFSVVVSFWAATISLNIYATTMIVYRIWRVVKQTSATLGLAFYLQQPKTKLQNIMRVIIESGMVYTFTTVVMFITLVVGSNSIIITSAAEMPIGGIAFNLILIRAKKASDSTILNTRPSRGISFAASPATLTGHDLESKSYP